MVDDYFRIPFIIDTITNSPAGHQLLTQSKKHSSIIFINGKDTITAKGSFEKLQYNHSKHLNPKVNISLCRRKS